VAQIAPFSSPASGKASELFRRLLAPRTALWGFFLLTLGFQVLSLTRWRPLYAILQALFYLEAALALRLAAAAARKDRLVLFVVLAVLVLRLPFLTAPSGLLTHSDNALEAIQALQIRDTHVPPPFLLGVLKHGGIFRHTLIAFVWDIVGPGYLSFALVQVLVFLAFLLLVYHIGLRFFSRKTAAVLCLAHFAFIEILFNYSLNLRSGPYLEMVVFALLGMALFDFDLRDRARSFLSAYFLAFAVATSPFGVFLILPFAAAVLLTRIRRPGFPKTAALLAAGAAAGSLLLVGKDLLFPPPPPTGRWFRIEALTLSDLRPDRWPSLLSRWAESLATAFRNVLGFEFGHHSEVSPEFAFRPESAALRGGLSALSGFLTALMAIVLITALVMAVRRLLLARREGRLGERWFEIYYLFLAGSFLGRVLLLLPKPFLEPRHNLDLALLLVWSAFFVLEAALRRRPPSRRGAAALAAGLMLLAAPHLFYFYKNTHFRAASYARILDELEARGVTAVSTDFGLAHCLYFLSGRKILASDATGPMTMPFFLPEVTRAVDALPPEKKAYVLYTPLYPQSDSERPRSVRIRNQLINDLRERGIWFHIEDLKYYELIIPES
jgi:hypothetical protein